MSSYNNLVDIIDETEKRQNKLNESLKNDERIPDPKKANILIEENNNNDDECIKKSVSDKRKETFGECSVKSRFIQNGTEDSNYQELTRKVSLMRNGLTDRSFLSWLRILLLAVFWWCFVIGFFCLCFFLMNMILYGSDNDEQPYFARDFVKYPGILDQPGLNIKCLNREKSENCDTTELAVSVNKIFNFKPVPFTKDEIPKELSEKLESLGAHEGLLEKNIYVTCEGRKDKDKDNLKGMKIGRPNSSDSLGIDVSVFPWSAQRNPWPYVYFDLSKTKVVLDKTTQRVFIECKAWAKNIDIEDRFVNKRTPRGGAVAVFCFDDGMIVKTEDCDDRS